jgi:Flp pilus assembly protein TadG
MPICSICGNRRRERGAALVELALVLTLLLTLFSGMVEFGRAIYQYETLTKSARNAARFLSQYSALDTCYSSANDSSSSCKSTTTGQSPYTVNQAKCLAVYGTTDCSGNPLVPGFSTTNVVVCDQSSASGCPNVNFFGYDVYDADNNSSLGTLEEAINLVEVKITGYQYSPIQSFFQFAGVIFGDIAVLMRQS